MGKPKGKKIALLAGGVMVVGTVFVAWVCRASIEYRYRLWQHFESLGQNTQGHREYRHRQTGIVFVELPGATFIMGSPASEELRGENEVQHEVTLSTFLIAKYEVSQAEWSKVVDANPSMFKGENLPVERVTWVDCQTFCEKTNLELPTEAQWEYACRAGTITPFAFGKTITTDQANYDGNYPYANGPTGEFRKETIPVDALEPNGFGLYHMHGNVWEWCADVFDAEFYAKPEATEIDPVCTSGLENRVVRGGGWRDVAGGCRSARRARSRPSGRLYGVGLRPVWSPFSTDFRMKILTTSDK